ncbi:MAG: exonuclease domain-containing protein [Bacteroidota bacterium]|nr:exonuclease domain-containing protein [Bacteroidota bacterium]
MPDLKFAIIDIETTGGSYLNDKITEIAIIIVENGAIIDRFESLVNPQRSIPYEITRITGITDDMVSGAPNFYEIAKDIVTLTESCIFVAHNVHFDYGFIRREFEQLGYSYYRKKLCTVQLSKKHYPGLRSYSLGSLINFLGIDVEQRHRAMQDALATSTLFLKMFQEGQKNNSISKHVREIVKQVKYPSISLAESVESLPESCGIYYMRDLERQPVYIGKSTNIRERIIQHFASPDKKNALMIQRVKSIDYLETGSELMALLMESTEIKKYKPEINKALRNSRSSHLIIKKINKSGYAQLDVIATKHLKDEYEIISQFANAKSAKSYISYLIQQYQLCTSINESTLFSNFVCDGFQLSLCLGACNSEESMEDYNDRFQSMVDEIQHVFKENFLLVDRGRNPQENSLILVEKGYCSAIGYLSNEISFDSCEEIKSWLDQYHGNVESNKMISTYLNSNRKIRKHVFLSTE